MGTYAITKMINSYRRSYQARKRRNPGKFAERRFRRKAYRRYNKDQY
jgi:hypothetical protein